MNRNRSVDSSISLVHGAKTNEHSPVALDPILRKVTKSCQMSVFPLRAVIVGMADIVCRSLLF